MWTLSIIGLFAALCIVTSIYSPWHVSILGVLVYFVYYVSNTHEQASRRWHSLRASRFWDWLLRKPRVYLNHTVIQGGNWASFDRNGQVYLFVTCPPVHYQVGNVATFSLHGRSCRKLNALSPSVLLPSYYFYVPVLTDILQWLGCCPNNVSVMQDLLDHGRRSVVWSYPASNDAMWVNFPFDIVSELAGKCVFSIVLVRHLHEKRLYRTFPFQLPFISALSDRYFAYTGHRLQCLWGWFWFSWLPRPSVTHPITTIIGDPVETRKMILDATDGKRYLERPKSAEEIKADIEKAYVTLLMIKADEEAQVNESEE